MEERVVDHFCELMKGNGNSVGGHFESQDDENFRRIGAKWPADFDEVDM
jgi:hypothetical protein